MRRMLLRRGHAPLLRMPCHGGGYLELSYKDPLTPLPDGSLVVLSGTGRRGIGHSVVGATRLDDGFNRYEYIHDPHPDGSFLESEPDWIGFLLSVPKK